MFGSVGLTLVGSGRVAMAAWIAFKESTLHVGTSSAAAAVPVARSLMQTTGSGGFKAPEPIWQMQTRDSVGGTGSAVPRGVPD